jgi:primosomal protein N' (replication factor Y)
LRTVATALARGESTLVLVPEIGLTPQLVARFRARFDVPMAVLHSGLSDGERLAAWRLTYSGAARIVFGTRSAVFAPLRSLGLIIIDEEHDSSFKQQEGGCRYSARDLAVQRANLAAVPIVLGSATPALETLHNAHRGRYQRLLLPRRSDQAPAPTLALIDLRAESVRDGLSGTVIRSIEKHLQADGQVLVYINRRGFAPTLLCTACGWIAPCEQCDARLTVHQRAQRLRCHYCGADHALPERCARCGYAVKPVGHGTERVEATLAAVFPQAPLVRIDRDAVRTTAQLEAVMHAVHSGAARLLVGTQMITKGHHFPNVTLVVVLNADQGLFSTDFRAAERLAQTVVQVAGRAGRESRPGEVLIQSEYPDHPLLQSLLNGGYEAFASAALEERAAARWPPFAHIALLRASASAEVIAKRFLSAARAIGEPGAAVKLLGPVSAAMARRAGRYHAQLLIEAATRGGLQNFLKVWVPLVEALPDANRVRWALDVDPIDTQ